VTDVRVTGVSSPYTVAERFNTALEGSQHRQLSVRPEEPKPSWLDEFNNQADEAGYLLINAATLGLGGWALGKLGFTNRVDKQSDFYQAASAVDTAIGLATLRPTKLTGSAWRVITGLGKGLHQIGVSAKKAVQVGAYASLGKVVAGAKKLTRATLGVASRLDYRRTFFEAYPHLKGKVVVHHAVEQRILNKYPHLISEMEMHSLENLRGIPLELNADLHLSKIRRSWDDFYLQYPHPTREQLLRKASEIDAHFGHLFLPPVN
jgi:hypothetical protein